MVGVQNSAIVAVPIELATGKEKQTPRDLLKLANILAN